MIMLKIISRDGEENLIDLITSVKLQHLNTSKCLQTNDNVENNYSCYIPNR